MRYCGTHLFKTLRVRPMCLHNRRDVLIRRQPTPEKNSVLLQGQPVLTGHKPSFAHSLLGKSAGDSTDRQWYRLESLL